MMSVKHAVLLTGTCSTLHPLIALLGSISHRSLKGSTVGAAEVSDAGD